MFQPCDSLHISFTVAFRFVANIVDSLLPTILASKRLAENDVKTDVKTWSVV